ncbi:reverse transcriptase domain-containing protein [Tanacetum coccineum]
MLTAPEEQEKLIVYLAASKEAVSAVLMTEREARQMPIYFVSRALRGPEVNYTSMEKLVLALVHASKMLKRYFQAHPIIVVTNQPIKNILLNPKVAADFIVKRPEEEGQDDSTKEEEPLPAQVHVLVEELKEKSVNEIEVLAMVEEEGDSWMTLIHEYLTDETLPAKRKKARAIKRKSQRFAIINGTLYKKSFLGLWLRCVGPSQANYVLREIHEGSCSMHAGTRSVVAKALRIGYYWPTMHKDARALIKACQECQVHKPVPRNPQEKLNPITSPWPFYKWGIDIAGPFPEGPGKVKFLIVAMDYFTKWIEAKLVATITGNQVKKFVWENIVCRFGLPGEIISDNGKQFRDNPFKDTMSSPNHSTSDIEDAFSSMNILNYTSDVQAFYARESLISPPDPITPPAILTPSPVLPPSLLFDPRYFFIPEDLLPPKNPPSSSSTTLSNSSRNQTCDLVSPSFSVYTPTPPQIFEIGKSSFKIHMKHHEEQIEDVLIYLDKLSFHHIEKMEEGRINDRMVIRRNGNELKTKLKRIRTQIIKLQKKQLGQKDKIAFAHYIISNLE